MLFSKVSLVAVAAFSGLSTAAPALASLEPQSFSIHQKATGRRHRKSGARALTHTYKKYGKKLPTSMLWGATYGNDTADPTQYDVEYLSPVSVGTPAKELMLVFDTGSADLWVYGSGNGHGGYDPSGSSSASQLQGEHWAIQYGDGSTASGLVYADKVEIGPITVTKQAVEAATSVSKAFASDAALDGIIGFGGDYNNQVSPDKQPTFFQNIQPTLASPVFAALLKHNAPGAFDFGYLNPQHYVGDILYTPADLSGGYWQITNNGYYIGYDYHAATLTSIVDTGTSLIYMTDQVVTDYYAQVPSAIYSAAAGGWIFDCNAQLPTFGINIGNGLRTVAGSFFNYAPANTAGSMCFGGLQSSNGLPFNILGDIFLKTCYAVFDAGNSQVGFASQGLI